MKVIITNKAARDIEQIHAYIAEHDSPDAAGYVVEQIEKAVFGLQRFPNRGPHPPELLELGNTEFRELFFKPYRIVYEVIEEDDTVLILLVADGRRDMRTLFQRRLLSA